MFFRLLNFISSSLFFLITLVIVTFSIIYGSSHDLLSSNKSFFSTLFFESIFWYAGIVIILFIIHNISNLRNNYHLILISLGLELLIIGGLISNKYTESGILTLTPYERIHTFYLAKSYEVLISNNNDEIHIPLDNIKVGDIIYNDNGNNYHVNDIVRSGYLDLKVIEGDKKNPAIKLSFIAKGNSISKDFWLVSNSPFPEVSDEINISNIIFSLKFENSYESNTLTDNKFIFDFSGDSNWIFYYSKDKSFQLPITIGKEIRLDNLGVLTIKNIIPNADIIQIAIPNKDGAPALLLSNNLTNIKSWISPLYPLIQSNAPSFYISQIPKELPFKLKLNEFIKNERTFNSNIQPYIANVNLYDIYSNNSKDFLIALNSPLIYKGYKIILLSFKDDPLTVVFKVSKTKGLLPIYLGVFSLLLGIASLLKKNTTPIKSKILLILTFGIISFSLGYIIFSNLYSTSKSITPVLQNNLFLIPHISSIILSYASLILAMFFSLVILWKKDNSSNLSSYVASLLQISSFLIVLGIIIGASWADGTWGYFWSWDPKESWALITFLITLIVLIGYQQNFLKNKSLALGVITSFFSLVITWYGVNYIFRTGFHSYGFNDSTENYHSNKTILSDYRS